MCACDVYLYRHLSNSIELKLAEVTTLKHIPFEINKNIDDTY